MVSIDNQEIKKNDVKNQRKRSPIFGILRGKKSKIECALALCYRSIQSNFSYTLHTDPTLALTYNNDPLPSSFLRALGSRPKGKRPMAAGRGIDDSQAVQIFVNERPINLKIYSYENAIGSQQRILVHFPGHAPFATELSSATQWIGGLVERRDQRPG
jgi:hypothetical protein